MNKSNLIQKYTLMVLLATFVLIQSPVLVRAYGSQFDGGMLNGIAEVCTCSGGMTIRVLSYVDNSSHVYLYQMGVTQLYENYNITSAGNYFLTTLAPFAMCLVYKGEECDSSSESPEGIFLETGTSFKNNKESVIAFLNELPGIPQVSEAFSAFIPNISWPTLKF